MENPQLRLKGWNAAARNTAVASALFVLASCAPSATVQQTEARAPIPMARPGVSTAAPSPDPRVGLSAGLFDAGEAIWNLNHVSTTPPPADFLGVTNSDLAFLGDYVIQGNYNGYQFWDISDPANPRLEIGYVCPASQSDVSVFGNLLFVSGEGLSGRLDCGTQGVSESISGERLRGLRIFDISDVQNPVNVGNVQTCRGSHTHTVLVDPDDRQNVYVYISGSSSVRPEEELPGCVAAPPSEDPASALFRIEVIRVPLANPGAAEIVSSPRIFDDLVAPPEHGLAPADREELMAAQARGEFVGELQGQVVRLGGNGLTAMLDSIVDARGGTGAPTAADTAALRTYWPVFLDQIRAQYAEAGGDVGPTQCHDITVYPEIGLAGGACEGYGFLLDITDPIDPRRLAAVSDSNFSYWHSATFNNDGTQILFSDEWGGGGQPKCRASDPREWGANALFSIEGREMVFESYYKLPAPQTQVENCVAHNGSLIPIPGRDIMVQSWYQGGISIFDWTDPANPVEIAYHDRGPVDATRQRSGGPWSTYWYNGLIISSEIARGLDIFELTPSPFISQNEIDAARTIEFDYFNTQGQRRFVWPPSFPLVRAYVDQLERSGALSMERISSIRSSLATAENASLSARASALESLADALSGEAARSGDPAKVGLLVNALRDLSGS